MAAEAGLEPLRPWRSRQPGHYDCIAATPGFGEATGPIRSYVALHVHGQASESALRIALQANVVTSADEIAAFSTLDQLVERTFAHIGAEVPERLRQAIRTRAPTEVRVERWQVGWRGTRVGNDVTSWTLRIDGS